MDGSDEKSEQNANKNKNNNENKNDNEILINERKNEQTIIEEKSVMTSNILLRTEKSEKMKEFVSKCLNIVSTENNSRTLHPSLPIFLNAKISKIEKIVIKILKVIPDLKFQNFGCRLGIFLPKNNKNCNFYDISPMKKNQKENDCREKTENFREEKKSADCNTTKRNAEIKLNWYSPPSKPEEHSSSIGIVKNLIEDIQFYLLRFFH